ncbi:hypothetical protein [Bradyrhizobium sp. 170]|uniref:hypothetical protein n=1 Tax=Bradyrhizobium sp. 170 TaxID=2782641 RepID=UPI001FFE900D|nr:hypothetical protein [Bradyrhizobium sp. 170]UPK07950.1 hypothetical protein IVB05_09480 [Bradyrhizobium sp. 170]
MTSETSRSFGLLALERGQPTGAPPPVLPGTVLDPAVFTFPVIWETVEGAQVERVVRGDPALEQAYVAAARRLVDRGAIAIHSTCGFAIRYQQAIAAAVKVPVATSSLLLLPALLRQFPAPAKVAVITYDSTALGEDLLCVDDPAERARLVVGGIEGGKVWHDERMVPPPPVDITAVEDDVTGCVARARGAHPEIAAILFECGLFPVVSSKIRHRTGLPVYDPPALCKLTLGSIA